MQPFFLPKAQIFCPNSKGGAWLNFAHYSYLFLHYWHPNGGAMAPCPPKYAPDYTQKHLNDGAITLYNIENNNVTNSVKKRNIEKLCHYQREKRNTEKLCH